MNTVQINSEILKKDAVGNTGLSSSKESYVAGKLKQINLERVNRESKQVIPKTGFYVRYGKRVVDFIVALLAFIVFSPLNIILAICTFLMLEVPLYLGRHALGKMGRNSKLLNLEI